MKSAKLVSGLLLGLALLASPAFAQRDIQRLNTEGIARAIGKQGDLTGERYKVSFPRSDLTVNVGNVVIKPALALMAWAAFIKSGNDAMTYGDLVLLEDEVNPVISKLEERGLELSLSTTISCTRRLASCISTLSGAETRWNWQK